MAATKREMFTALAFALTAVTIGAQNQPPPCGGQSATPQVACQADVDQMMAALPGEGAGEAAEAAQRARAGARRRLCPLLDPAGREDGRSARDQDRRVEDDDHL